MSNDGLTPNNQYQAVHVLQAGSNTPVRPCLAGASSSTRRARHGWSVVGPASLPTPTGTQHPTQIHPHWPMAAPRSACDQARSWRQREMALSSKCPPFLPNIVHRLLEETYQEPQSTKWCKSREQMADRGVDGSFLLWFGSSPKFCGRYQTNGRQPKFNTPRGGMISLSVKMRLMTMKSRTE